jgi:hypothetical protein
MDDGWMMDGWGRWIGGCKKNTSKSKNKNRKEKPTST